MVTLKVGERVVATRTVTEGGDGYVGLSFGAWLPSKNYVHASEGDEGTVIHVTENGEATVRFDRQGTATLVFDGEVRRC